MLAERCVARVCRSRAMASSRAACQRSGSRSTSERNANCSAGTVSSKTLSRQAGRWRKRWAQRLCYIRTKGVWLHDASMPHLRASASQRRRIECSMRREMLRFCMRV